MEFETGSIPGFRNIPLDSLRERLHELDKSKRIYVTCQIGLRGYIACRILTQHGFDCYNLSGGYRLYSSIFQISQPEQVSKMNPETQLPEQPSDTQTPTVGTQLTVDACGLQCPGPIVKLGAAIKEAKPGDTIEISTTDPAFASDLEGFCRRTGHQLESLQSSKGKSVARIRKGADLSEGGSCPVSQGNNKNFIVFSGDLDKAIASFIMANAAAAMGRKVSMFFTFWGLNILRKPEKSKVQKEFMENMFGAMMPRGAGRLKLSKMNMGGMGAKMIRRTMKNKNIDSLEDLIKVSQENGVELIACAMSMDVMGIKQEELIDGVKTGGAASMLAFAEESDMSLFI
jgi:peroxiredoxin family protein/TusA-related sulfurtransferase